MPVIQILSVRSILNVQPFFIVKPIFVDLKASYVVHGNRQKSVAVTVSLLCTLNTYLHIQKAFGYQPFSSKKHPVTGHLVWYPNGDLNSRQKVWQLNVPQMSIVGPQILITIHLPYFLSANQLSVQLNVYVITIMFFNVW